MHTNIRTHIFPRVFGRFSSVCDNVFVPLHR